MGFWSPPKAKRLVAALTLGLAGLFASGCGNDKPGGVVDDPSHGHIDPRDACATPNAGCQCDTPARSVECGTVQRRAGDQVWCSVGHRICGADNLWGDCQAEGFRVLPASTPSQTAQALGTAQACVDNPCDPYCQQVVDSGSDLDLPTGLQQTADGGITLTAKEGSINDTTCTGISVTPTPQTLNVRSLNGAGAGLLGEYFAQNFDGGIPATAQPTTTRLDPTIDFVWLDGSPMPELPVDYFSVRWTGFLKPPTTDAFQLCTWSDDGVRLWVGDQLLIDKWVEQGPTYWCADLPAATLTAGKLYPIRLEYFEVFAGSAVRLLWRYSGIQGDEIIPATALVPPGGENAQGGFTVDPKFAQFSVQATPPGCFVGPVRAAWADNRLDRSSIDNTGKLSLFAPIAGDINVTAYAGTFSATGQVHVNVDVFDTADAPTGTADKFDDAPTGTDPMKVLYPYADTVLPLALRAPTIQWDNGGVAADAVQVSLRYPATGPTSFAWSKVLPDSNPGRYTIPQDVWSLFEGSAKGQAAAFSVQRVTGGVLRPAVTRNLTFAVAPVRGKIYYTQYARNGATNIMVADPGSPTSAASVFASDAGGSYGRKCPVCHSVSANGTVFATSDRSFSANGGLSKINPNGSFTPLSDYSSAYDPYRTGQDDWRGFAWSPLTPDGKYALAANNIWGNTNQRVVGIDTGTRQVALPGGFVSGGGGTGLLAKYYMNPGLTGWDWRRIDPKIDFDWGTASPGGPVPADFSVSWTGQIQAYTSELHTFTVETSGGVRLSIGGNVIIDQLGNALLNQKFVGTAALTKGVKTAIALQFADTTGTAQVKLRWSTPTFLTPTLVPETQLYPNDGWHGVLATYYDNNDFTNPFISGRIESNLDANWADGGPRPMPSGDNDNWSAIFTGQLQAPATGNLVVCSKSDDDVTVTVGNATRITKTGVSDSCSLPFAVTEGTRYPLEVRYRELTGDAFLNLRWSMSGATTFADEVVPSARLTPPAAWTPPTHGLTASYYDNSDFNLSLPTNALPAASTRIEENADLTWGSRRPEFSSAITSNDYFSSRFTGRLSVPCSGLYEFEVFGDDGGRLWIDDLRVVHRWSYGTQQGAVWLDAGMHDLKLDHREDGGQANVNLRWKADCIPLTAFTPIPNANLYPDGDNGTAGYVQAGGDNGNDSSYFVWQTPTAAGTPPQDVTASSNGRWGLGATVMMVPSFAPDGSKLVFVDGDSAAGNGWRKGLSVFSFDETAQLFKNRKTVVSTWPNGDVLKWPVFESDSRSVIYQATVPADACCRKSDWTKYGYMGPTNYFEDPGRLFSVDTQAAAPVPVELRKLNQGERAFDRNKSYQATMLPQASAGYRWAVFTSTRPYGNTLNLDGQQDFSDTKNYTYISDYTKLQSMLWVSAIDDTPSGATDRSHPAFFLPNQNFAADATNGYLNERAYWVAEACHPPGTTQASACDVDEDCCGGGAGTAVCRIDSPVTVPPTRHCFKLPDANDCAKVGAACASSADCCTGTVCDDGACVKPPAFASYAPANFERVYESNCASGQKVHWTFFDYKASVPDTAGAIEFYAESADDVSAFHTLPPYPSAVSVTGVALIGTASPPGDLNDWIPLTLDTPLSNANIVQRKYLKITARLVPSQSGIAAPVLSAWRQSFSCPPGE